MNPTDAYAWLLAHNIEASYLDSLGNVTAWDQRTYLPIKGHPHRAEQLAVLARVLHERATDPKIEERLQDVEGSDIVAVPTSKEAVNVREWRRIYDRSTRIPKRLAEELARATAECETVWEKARPLNDWQGFKPHLARVLDLLIEKADAIGYEQEAYDALLDYYEPGETAASLEATFSVLRKALVDLINRIQNSDVKPESSVLKRHFPVNLQERFLKSVVRAIGYDFEAGRIDTTTHPFTIGIGPGDVRITIRYFENHFPAALFGAIHEAGHGMYEQGLPSEHWGTPMGQIASLGIHESQSRLFENLVGRSKGLWRHFFNQAKTEFDSFKDMDIDRFVLAINAVEPSLIRVDADEVTYNLHILLRFDLELALLRRDLVVDDLPDAWNEKMKAYLGIEPKDMKSGVMQDVHWSAGLVGYFPTYTLGNIYAAQLFNKAEEDLGNLDDQFQQGQFDPLLNWLKEKIHKPGGTYGPRDLIHQATGSNPSPKHLIRYCQKKYSALYQL